jgi:hypothetical protein
MWKAPLRRLDTPPSTHNIRSPATSVAGLNFARIFVCCYFLNQSSWTTLSVPR